MKNADITKKIQDAIRLIMDDRKDEAQVLFNQLLNQEITDVHTLAQFGELAFLLGENVHAINALSAATEAAPDNAAYLDLFAQILISIQNYDKAMELLDKAIQLKPDSPHTYARLAGLHFEMSRFEESIKLLEKAVALKPGDALILAQYIETLRYCDRYEEALKYAHKLVRINDKDPVNYERLARVYIELGNIDEAKLHLHKAMRLDPAYGKALYTLTTISKFTTDDQTLIDQAEKSLKQPMSVKNRTALHFALGKIYDDCKLWDKAFNHFRQANILTNPGIEDRTTRDSKRFRKTRKTYTRKFIKNTGSLGSKSEVPVFVVGMPRSGTTLIEQIISSHSQGEAAGELNTMSLIELAICPDNTLATYDKQVMANLEPKHLNQHIQQYLEKLTSNRNSASRIVDKMPDNYLYLGLINLLFPRARIIHAIRNPLDTCLSCYFQSFTFIKWANDLEWIAARYRMYREAMDYWKYTFPEGRIIDVHYEDIVGNPETEIHRLIEACNLPWEDQCLDFHKNERAITTSSVWQVRQPLYTSSRKRWSHYAPYLENLANKLADFLSPEDIDEFEKHGIRIRKGWRLGFGR